MFDQDQTPVGTCIRCGGELYAEEENNLCINCRLELRRWDERTVEAVMEAFDDELKKYLSNNLRNTVRNFVADQFYETES